MGLLCLVGFFKNLPWFFLLVVFCLFFFFKRHLLHILYRLPAELFEHERLPE